MWLLIACGPAPSGSAPLVGGTPAADDTAGPSISSSCGEQAPVLTSIASETSTVTVGGGATTGGMPQVEVEWSTLQVVATATDDDGDLDRVSTFAWFAEDDGVPLDTSVAPISAGTFAEPTEPCTTFVTERVGIGFTVGGEDGLTADTAYRVALAAEDAEGRRSEPLEIVFVTPPAE